MTKLHITVCFCNRRKNAGKEQPASLPEAPQPAPAKPGVSLKQLLKESNKAAKEKHGCGADAPHELAARPPQTLPGCFSRVFLHTMFCKELSSLSLLLFWSRSVAPDKAALHPLHINTLKVISVGRLKEDGQQDLSAVRVLASDLAGPLGVYGCCFSTGAMHACPIKSWHCELDILGTAL